MKEKIDTKKLNDVISLSKKILKLLYAVMIIVGIYALTIVFKEWEIWKITSEILGTVIPLFIGIVIAWLFNPLVNKLQKKGLRRSVSTGLIYLILVAIIIIMISLIIPAITDQINDFVKIIPSVLDTVKSWLEKIISGFTNVDGLDINNMETNIFAKIENYANGLASSVPETTIVAVKGLFSGLATFVIGLIIGFFLLISFDNIGNLLSFLPENIKNVVEQIGNEIDSSLRKFVEGTLILSTLVFICSALGFSIGGLKLAILFGLFCGITNIIPYVGPYIGGAPAIIVGFAQGPVCGIIVLITILIVQFVEGNLLQPIVMSKTMKLHPVSIILALLIFGKFWGIIGMIVATPIVAIIKILFNYFNDKYQLIVKTK